VSRLKDYSADFLEPGEKLAAWRKDPEGDRIERYRKTPAAPRPDFG